VTRPVLLQPKIVSGGQTGVDRAALAWAMRRGFEVGGWCPKGRRAEDGTVPARFPLRETASERYKDRTRRNVKDSDATLILTRGRLKSGTAYTARAALELGKPFFVVKLGTTPLEVARLWLIQNQPRRLNVAGPRESLQPGIGAAARRALAEIFRGVRLASSLRRVPRPGRNGRRRLVGPRAATRGA
jgi:hypothetical protein